MRKRAKTARTVGDAEADVGKRIRLRRLELKMSQTALGDKVGVTFQQVQKYESGTNRVSANRLLEIAKVLDAPISFFLSDYAIKTKMESVLFLNDALGVRLVRAFSKVHNKQVRQQIVSLVEGLAQRKR